MNSDTLSGKWLQIRGDVKKAWGKLTEHDLDEINGDMDKLSGKLQEHYGYSQDKAQREINDFRRKISDKNIRFTY